MLGTLSMILHVQADCMIMGHGMLHITMMGFAAMYGKCISAFGAIWPVAKSFISTLVGSTNSTENHIFLQPQCRVEQVKLQNPAFSGDHRTVA